MAHESFEDPDIAAVMNERFVCVKVDREERPDVDAICMEACQAITGHGGWPLNAFLTPDQAPFYAGTYFPPESRHGLPSWRMVLDAIADAWQSKRDEIVSQGAQFVETLGATARLDPSPEPIDEQGLIEAVSTLKATYDRVNGGFGRAPKFPPASTIELLLSRGEHEMSVGTLRSMAQGGIYDQVGGGFARYAVDATWTVPHFEKMLYDNALLCRVYAHLWRATGSDLARRVAVETADFLVRELRTEQGGFASALDADSDDGKGGHAEGAYYVWTPQQLSEALGEKDAELAAEYFGVTEEGTFEEGASVLRLPDREAPADAGRVASVRERLLAARGRRPRPGRDD